MTSSRLVYDITWLILKANYSSICFLLLALTEEQRWAGNYGQHNPDVLGSYPVAAENPPQLLPDQPSYYEGMFSQIKTFYQLIIFKDVIFYILLLHVCFFCLQ